MKPNCLTKKGKNRLCFLFPVGRVWYVILCYGQDVEKRKQFVSKWGRVNMEFRVERKLNYVIYRKIEFALLYANCGWVCGGRDL